MRAARRNPFSGRSILLAVFVAGLPCVLFAQGFEKPVHELAQKILVAGGGHGSMTLEVRNNSSLSPGEVARVRRDLEAELRKEGVKLVAAPPAETAVRVTLAENLQGYLWVAQISIGETQRIAMVSAPKSATEGVGTGEPKFVFDKKLIWSQTEEILDLRFVQGADKKAKQMAILERTGLMLYRQSGGGWDLSQAFPITPSAWPRDLRGALFVNDGIAPDDVLLIVAMPSPSGWILRHQQSAQGLVLEREEGKPSFWFPMAGSRIVDAVAEFEPLRNFFTGKIYGEGGTVGKVPPFLSTALVGGESELWIYADLDGKARLNDRDQFIATIGDWGSDLASIQTTCGSGWQVLATGQADWTQPDTVRGYEIRDGSAIAVTTAAQFPGPVMSLGSLGKGVSVAVVLNLKTGRYEAYTLAISCSQ